jgi:hypothetical protein
MTRANEPDSEMECHKGSALLPKRRGNIMNSKGVCLIQPTVGS